MEYFTADFLRVFGRNIKNLSVYQKLKSISKAEYAPLNSSISGILLKFSNFL